MEKYLTEMLHMDTKCVEATELYDCLPLFFKGTYTIYKVNSGGVKWIALQPKTNVRLSQIRKNQAFLEQKKQMNVAVFLEKASFYSKDKMMEEGIPFVIRNDSVYLPFIGFLLGKKQRELKPVYQISFLTQRILLLGIYEGYDRTTVSKLAEHLAVSKMAISKSFDEIEYMDIGVMENGNRRRSITIRKGDKEAWERICPFMRNPVIKVFELKEDVKLPVKAGISALSEYSMLADNNYPTYAIEKKGIASSGIRDMKQAGRGDDVGCRIYELGYLIDDIKKGVQDPLSVILSIGDEMNDERVEASVNEMLREYVW